MPSAKVEVQEIPMYGLVDSRADNYNQGDMFKKVTAAALTGESMCGVCDLRKLGDELPIVRSKSNELSHTLDIIGRREVFNKRLLCTCICARSPFIQ